MNWFRQNDPAYGSQIIGHNIDPTATIARFGCVITSYGNMLLAITGDAQYNPSFMNQWAKNAGAFVGGTGIWIWSAGMKLGVVNTQGVTDSLRAINDFLVPKPNFAILEVNNGSHFVLGNQVNTIIDPADGKQKSMNSYKGFVKAHLFSAINISPAPSLPTAAPVTSGMLNAIVTINVPILNARSKPTTESPVVAKAHAGTIHVNQWVAGENVTVNGRTDNIWLLTDGGHWIAQAGTTYRE